MLLLFVRLFEHRKPPPEEVSQRDHRPSETETDLQTRTHTIQQLHHARAAYYLERRLFL